jgi:hypothetical protein
MGRGEEAAIRTVTGAAMATKELILRANWTIAVFAGLIGCNAILDNPKGELASAGASTSSGGLTSLATGGSPTLGGASATTDSAPMDTGGTLSTIVNLSTGASASLGGAASGGAASGSSTTAGGTTPTTTGAQTGGTPATGGVSSKASTSAGVLPTVVFSSASISDAASTNLTSASFQFASIPGGASAFKCKFNAATAFADCTNGFTVSQLSAGSQTLTVYAVDSAGNAGPTATRSWTVSALSTTIKAIRAGAFDDYLVSVSYGVRLTGFATESSQQVIFVQEAGPTRDFLVDSMTTLSGNSILNSGILTRPATAQTVRAEGTLVTVVGTVAREGSNLELVRASYTWSTGTTQPYGIPRIRTSAVFAAGLEGVHIAVVATVSIARSVMSTDASKRAVLTQHAARAQSSRGWMLPGVPVIP